MTNKKAVTLMELVVVIIVIGILATVAVSHHASTKELVLDKEGISNLKLLRAAEIAFKLEMGSYYPSTGSVSDISMINQNLAFMLATGANRSWNYMVKSTGCSQATRNGSNGRIMYLEINDADGEPNIGGACP